MPKTIFPIALHTWTIDTTPLATALDAVRWGGYDAVELRRIDFKRCFEQGLSNDDVLSIVRRSEVPVCTLGVEYGWLFAKGAESKRLFGVFVESCKNAVALKCGMLMSAPGPVVGTVAEAIANLKIAGDIAGEYGLRLAIEFNSQHEVLNRLEIQREVVGGSGKKNVGLLLDAYHLARSGRPGRGFEEVAGDDIFCFQYSDLSPNPVTGVKRPTDRLVPGQGVIRWKEIFDLLREKGYKGYISYEAPNPALWERSPYEVCREGVTATGKLMAL